MKADNSQHEIGKSSEAVELKAANASVIATVSHELRTPLTAVLGSLDILERMELPFDVAELVDVIRRNAKHEARMLDDLLDANRIDKEKLHLERQAVNLRTAVEQSMEVVRSEIEAKQLKVLLDFGAVPHVDADPDRLQQILWNVLRNAVKFTPVSGHIFVRCEDADPENAILVVQDTGVGIKADILPTVFEPFEQGMRSAHFGGLGLGLSIVKGLVELHGGRVSIESSGAGAGTTVTLTIPRSKYLPKPHKSPTSLTPENQKGANILLVEDHPDTLKILARLLERLNYRVVTAATVRSARTAATDPSLNILVSDIGLPDGTGFELMNSLRERFVGKAIALTGYGMDEDVKQSEMAGFTRHLTKPVNFEKLHEFIEELA